MKKRLIRYVSVIATLILYLLVSTKYITNVDAAGSYYIQVNKGTNVVTVFKSNGTPYKAFLCSTGTATPVGTFYTPSKYRWHELMGPSYGQYCTRITRGFLFHSVWYYTNGDYKSQSTAEYNKLGTTCSHGCVRLSVADSKWIYDNCPLKTKVIIINGKSKNDPLGKPTLYKVSTKYKKGWDPTDPQSANPYRTITFSGAYNKTINKTINSTVNILKGVSAKDKAGVTLTKYIKVTIKYPGNTKASSSKASTLKLTKVGTYEVTYSVTSPYSKVTKKIVTKYVVKDTLNPTLSGVEANMTVQANSTKNIKSNVTAKSAAGENLTKYIKITMKKPGDTKASVFSVASIKFSKLGNYVVTYSVTNPKNKKTTTKTVTYTSKDLKKPTISGLSNKTVEYKYTYDVRSGVTAKSYMGNNLTSNIKVSAKDPNGTAVTITNNKIVMNKLGVYTITYSVTNASKVTNTTSIKVTVTDTKVPTLTVKLSATYKAGTKIDLLSKASAVTTTGKNISSKIQVAVKDNNGKAVTLTNGILLCNKSLYTITYTVKGDNGKTATKTVEISVTGVNSSVTGDANEDGLDDIF